MGVATVPIRINYPGAGGPGVNTWHFRWADPVGGAIDECSDMLHDFYTAISNCYTPATTITFDGVVKEVGVEGPFHESATWSVTGSDTDGRLLPVAAQICVNWTTEELSRRGRGRTFLGPLGVGCLDGDGTGTISAARLTSLSTAALALVERSVEVNNGALAVYSPTDGLARDFTGFRVKDQFAVLRSRRD